MHFLIGRYVNSSDGYIFPRFRGTAWTHRAGHANTRRGTTGRGRVDWGGGARRWAGRRAGDRDGRWSGSRWSRRRGGCWRLPSLRALPPARIRTGPWPWALAGPVLLWHSQLVTLLQVRNTTRGLSILTKVYSILTAGSFIVTSTNYPELRIVVLISRSLRITKNRKTNTILICLCKFPLLC